MGKIYQPNADNPDTRGAVKRAIDYDEEQQTLSRLKEIIKNKRKMKSEQDADSKAEGVK